MRRLYPSFLGGAPAVGLLMLRLVVGTAMMLHGSTKIGDPFHWMDAMHPGVPPVFQGLAALAESGGGLAIMLGLLTPIAAFGMACNMVVALAMVHLPQGHPFVAQGGPSFESALYYLATMVLLLMTGPGRISVDDLLFDQAAHTTQRDKSVGTSRAARFHPV